MDLAQARADLRTLRHVQNPLEVQVRTSAVLNRLLARIGGSAVIVGGSAVSFYTGGAYLSRDVDLLTAVSGQEISGILEKIGLLIDRLNAAVHWNDSEAREWCITMLELHPDLDRGYLRDRAAAEGVAGELDAVLEEIGRL